MRCTAGRRLRVGVVARFFVDAAAFDAAAFEMAAFGVAAFDSAVFDFASDGFVRVGIRWGRAH